MIDDNCPWWMKAKSKNLDRLIIVSSSNCLLDFPLTFQLGKPCILPSEFICGRTLVSVTYFPRSLVW